MILYDNILIFILYLYKNFILDMLIEKVLLYQQVVKKQNEQNEKIWNKNKFLLLNYVQFILFQLHYGDKQFVYLVFYIELMLYYLLIKYDVKLPK